MAPLLCWDARMAMVSTGMNLGRGEGEAGRAERMGEGYEVEEGGRRVGWPGAPGWHSEAEGAREG